VQQAVIERSTIAGAASVGPFVHVSGNIRNDNGVTSDE
jgi:hypothetical protein